eukprot:UN22497
MADKEVKICTKAVLHEFICMTLFVYIGCGVATNPTFNLQNTALAFGMAIMVLVYAIAHTSGGQLNWAVTIGLMVSGDLESLQGCANMLAQLFGGIIGAALLFATLPDDMEQKLGSNEVQRANGYTAGMAFFAEFVFSFMLVFVVFQTAVDKGAITGSNDSARPVTAPIAIGFQFSLPIFSSSQSLAAQSILLDHSDQL